MALSDLSEPDISAIIEIILSALISFAGIRQQYGRSDSQVKALIGANPSHQTLLKRMRRFCEWRERHKQTQLKPDTSEISLHCKKRLIVQPQFMK
ncbi:MAG: hypothetical protein AAF941_02245 [Pseudomonadota bacterium]